MLQPEKTYHIYNHANGNENLFRNEDNYFFFLEKYNKYISLIAFTFAYCLMPNHFHFLIRLKDEKTIIDTTFQKFGTFGKFSVPEFISKQFSNFFSSYTQSYNKVFERKGSLFTPNCKNKLVDNPVYLFRVINYIHMNPVLHNFVKKPGDWKFSSYNAYFSSKSSKIARETVLSETECTIDEFKKRHHIRDAEKFSLETDFF